MLPSKGRKAYVTHVLIADAAAEGHATRLAAAHLHGRAVEVAVTVPVLRALHSTAVQLADGGRSQVSPARGRLQVSSRGVVNGVKNAAGAKSEFKSQVRSRKSHNRAPVQGSEMQKSGQKSNP